MKRKGRTAACGDAPSQFRLRTRVATALCLAWTSDRAGVVAGGIAFVRASRRTRRLEAEVDVLVTQRLIVAIVRQRHTRDPGPAVRAPVAGGQSVPAAGSRRAGSRALIKATAVVEAVQCADALTHAQRPGNPKARMRVAILERGRDLRLPRAVAAGATDDTVQRCRGELASQLQDLVAARADTHRFLRRGRVVQHGILDALAANVQRLGGRALDHGERDVLTPRSLLRARVRRPEARRAADTRRARDVILVADTGVAAGRRTRDIVGVWAGRAVGL